MLTSSRAVGTGALFFALVVRSAGVLLLDQGLTSGTVVSAWHSDTQYAVYAESLRPDTEVAINKIQVYGERLPSAYGIATLYAQLFRVSFFSANYDQLGFPAPGSILKSFDIMSTAPEIISGTLVQGYPIESRDIKLPELVKLFGTQRYFIDIVPVFITDDNGYNGPITLSKPGEGLVWFKNPEDAGWRQYNHGDLAFQLYGYGTQFKPDAVPEPATALVLVPLLLFIKRKKRA